MILKPYSNSMYRVQLNNISKSFGGIAALKDVTLKIRPGEIHALVGENGAGKSTLMKILSGAYSKDTGKILIDEQEELIRNTHDSKKLGIGIIYQEFSLVPDLSVAENIFLSQLGGERSWMKWKSMKRQADTLINSLGFNIDPSVKVGKLSIAYQQIVEISKALSEKAKILILDEPSAVLGLNEIQKLFETLIQLKMEGVSIIYITHHLDEIFRIADRVSVLKDGISSESLNVSETNKDSLIQLMLGRSLDTMFPEREAEIGDEILKVEAFNLEKKLINVSFLVRSGEVIGLAGLVGSGRTETVRALFGADKVTGNIYFRGKKIRVRTPHDAVKFGIGMVPEDRKRQGVVLPLSIRENISLANFNKVTDKLAFINARKELINTSELINKLTIKATSVNMTVGALSGGNQQKVSLAKWINRDCKVMIIDEPTRGVDVGAKVEIYHLIHAIADWGVAVIIVSSETTELMGICNRILVMRKGQIQGELQREEFSEEAILRLSIGA
jgi:ribose transport system ATP-binding protein